MTIGVNLTKFYGKTVEDFESSDEFESFSEVAPRIRIDWDSTDIDYQERLSALLGHPASDTLEAFILGAWFGEESEGDPRQYIEMLVANKDRIQNLKALFIGDVTYEENEISWIEQGDLSSVWSAFPKLEECYARGGNGLRLGKINSTSLKKLVIQTGGMPATIVREALEANAPLEHLELWLGTENYGASSSVQDFTALLEGKLFPDLKYLGLCNNDYADELAEALAASAILDRIEVLDISKGTMTDRGAKALLASGKLSGLKKLDIHHHYVSDGVVKELQAAVPDLDASEAETADDDDWRYVAVSE